MSDSTNLPSSTATDSTPSLKVRLRVQSVKSAKKSCARCALPLPMRLDAERVCPRGFEQESLGHFTNGIQNVRSIRNNVVTLTTSGGNGTLFEPREPVPSQESVTSCEGSTLRSSVYLRLMDQDICGALHWGPAPSINAQQNCPEFNENCSPNGDHKTWTEGCSLPFVSLWIHPCMRKVAQADEGEHHYRDN